MACDDRVGVQPTPLEGKIGELRALMNGLGQGCWDESCYALSKGPCRDTMTQLDKEFTYELYQCLWHLINATVKYLEDTEAELSPL
ncbi:MAG: hypothetical protein FWG40_06505 [Peptococcaceae bacterium]|nr:hypothetical protein [Peptococcaceae bacterium]